VTVKENPNISFSLHTENSKLASSFENYATARDLYQTYVGEVKSIKNKEVYQYLANKDYTQHIDVGRPQVRGNVTLDERLYDGRSMVKQFYSKFSMHFSKELRRKIFLQIDLIHEIDDWDVRDKVITAKSFETYIRWQFLNKEIRQLPNYGLTSEGNFVATWLKNENLDHLIVEFQPLDRVRWYSKEKYNGEIDNNSGICNILRFNKTIGQEKTIEWFN
jgi:hypothetical protein